MLEILSVFQMQISKINQIIFSGIKISIYAYSDIFEKMLRSLSFIIQNNVKNLVSHNEIMQNIRSQIRTAQSKTPTEKYVSYYNILVKMNMLNPYLLDPNITDIPVDIEADLNLTVKNQTLIRAIFYGDISKEKAIELYNQYFTFIDPEASNIESHYNTTSEELVLGYLHYQKLPNESLILAYDHSTTFSFAGNTFGIGEINEIDRNKVKLLYNSFNTLFYPLLKEFKIGFSGEISEFLYDGYNAITLCSMYNTNPVAVDGIGNSANALLDKMIGKFREKILNLEEGDLLHLKETLYNTYWKTYTSLEQRVNTVFNCLYVNSKECLENTINKKELEKITLQEIKDLFNDIFYNKEKLTKLSIQIIDDQYDIQIVPKDDYRPSGELIKESIISRNDFTYIMDHYKDWKG